MVFRVLTPWRPPGARVLRRCLVVLAILGSCSQSDPRIPYGVMQLVYYQGPVRPEERFSFFVIAEDDDGIENLDELYLYHDREGLRWTLSAEDWITLEEGGVTWIGSRAIAMAGEDTLPRGQYRAVLINKGGAKTERTFSFDAPAEPRYPFPRLTLHEGDYRIASRYPEHFLICYDETGSLITTLKVKTLQGSLASMELPAQVKAVSLWAWDGEYETAALTDVLALP
ncbi:MAG: hypothetical protein LBP88_00525 [Treponema sp.]|nr:hypothetical protein [Treponema sp.]